MVFMMNYLKSVMYYAKKKCTCFSDATKGIFIVARGMFNVATSSCILSLPIFALRENIKLSFVEFLILEGNFKT